MSKRKSTPADSTAQYAHARTLTNSFSTSSLLHSVQELQCHQLQEAQHNNHGHQGCDTLPVLASNVAGAGKHELPRGTAALRQVE
eukprot:CAMPEP_0204019528 /NCGR_PEP_ID=MMETSP0360-20130528/28819_1 /ASSEMBLY_ACC=CAM_ASM_000342 /TAXON_ID=268821 /ORGANISM="Scrippsiella Hangoei, Strain SHTV-5" /LENGTH=84 /DNA_ID=CAMNT_0050962763 /DNA_START=191 /DNA_END=442 /DNA_ORIENTATION=+